MCTFCLNVWVRKDYVIIKLKNLIKSKYYSKVTMLAQCNSALKHKVIQAGKD